MTEYIGIIKETKSQNDSYYNFKPICKRENGRIIAMDEQLFRDELIPQSIQSIHEEISIGEKSNNEIESKCKKIVERKNAIVLDFSKDEIDFPKPNYSYPWFTEKYKVLEKIRQFMGLNTILYGPPGTGKTYNAVKYAVSIINPDKLIEDREKIKKAYEDYMSKGMIKFVTFHQSYGYEEFIEGIKPVLNENQDDTGNTNKSTDDKTGDDTGDLKYVIAPGIFKKFCDDAKKDPNKANKYVFIIDEINRGNISKIFGELITLIEPDKRAGADEEMSVKLPYSPSPFSVPDNVYILGTMNTADRSIALIDTALRRRFNFKEMMPEPDLLEGVEVEGVEVKRMFETINRRIEILYDREHTIGHAFFMKLKENSSIDVLADIFKTNIIPLLQEYFYEDYKKIQWVLGDNAKSGNDLKFITEEIIAVKEVFLGDVDPEDINREKIYKINEKAFSNPKSYIGIYKKN